MIDMGVLPTVGGSSRWSRVVEKQPEQASSKRCSSKASSFLALTFLQDES